jgi:hypothetical protein
MSLKTEYHVDVSFLHDLTTGVATNKSANKAADEAAERRREFSRQTQDALLKRSNPCTGARMLKMTMNKIKDDVTLYNEMQNTLSTGRDPKNNKELTPLQIEYLKCKIKKMEATQRRNEFNKYSKIWDRVLKNCNKSQFDEWTLGQILEYANIISEGEGSWDRFTIIWNSLQPESKRIVSDFLLKKGTKNVYRYSQIRP